MLGVIVVALRGRDLSTARHGAVRHVFDKVPESVRESGWFAEEHACTDIHATFVADEQYSAAAYKQTTHNTP